MPGDAVFMTGTPNVVPHAMLHNIKHNKVLHQRNILVTVVMPITSNVPKPRRRRPVDKVSTGCRQCRARKVLPTVSDWTTTAVLTSA